MSTSKNSFTLVHVTIVVLVVAIIGLSIWLIYDRSKQNSDTQKSAATTQAVQEKPKATQDKPVAEKRVDPTADWVVLSSREGRFSLKHPASWVQPSNPEACSPGIVLLSSSQELSRMCATDGGSHMAIIGQRGDHRDSFHMDKTYYPDVVSASVIVDGVTGKRYEGTYKMLSGEDGIGPQDGDREVMYVFYVNDYTYTATYRVTGYPDVLADFDTMVTETLRFQP